MSCLFCDFIDQKGEHYAVYQDDSVYAFLDHKPLKFGHTLVVPNQHVETFHDLDKHSMSPFFSSLQTIAQAVKEAMEAQGTFIATNSHVSQSVAHFHMHVVPRQFHDGLKGFFWPRYRYESPQHMASVSRRIANRIDKNR